MLGMMPAPQIGWREDCEILARSLSKALERGCGYKQTSHWLGTDDHIRIALGLTTAE